MHYMSERLGNLESGGKGGFKFWFDGAPSQWPRWYLHSVLAHDLSKQKLMEVWLYEAGHDKSQNFAVTVPAQEAKKVQETAQDMTKRLSQIGARFAGISKNLLFPGSGTAKQQQQHQQ